MAGEEPRMNFQWLFSIALNKVEKYHISVYSATYESGEQINPYTDYFTS